jgi:hypothetical protein
MNFRFGRSCAILSIIFLAGGEADNLSGATGHRLVIVYVNAERTDYYEFHESVAAYKYIYPINRQPGQRFTNDESDLGGNQSLRDCSDPSFRCVTMDGLVLAVPRRGLIPNSRYVAAGSSLAVIKCMRGTSNVCQVALIETQCLFDAYKNQCVLDTRNSERGVRQRKMYFIYNEDVGVTSFGWPTAGHNSNDDAMGIAREYHLQGDVGLMK